MRASFAENKNNEGTSAQTQEDAQITPKLNTIKVIENKNGFKDIPIRDKILLGPIDKYRKYNNFPWKFLLHILMIIATTFQVIYVVQF